MRNTYLYILTKWQRVVILDSESNQGHDNDDDDGVGPEVFCMPTYMYESVIDTHSYIYRKKSTEGE